MNQFLTTTTDGALLKTDYPDRQTMSTLMEALRRRRRRRKENWPGMEPNDMDQVKAANTGLQESIS